MRVSARIHMIAIGLVFVSAGGMNCLAARKFTILDGQTITLPTDEQDNPWNAETKEFKVDAVGMKLAKRKDGNYWLHAMFGIIAKKNVTVNRILIEDVTGPKAVVVGVAEKPEFPDKTWKAIAPFAQLTENKPAWVYAPDDTWLVYRITISTVEKGDVVMFQAGHYDLFAKVRLHDPRPDEKWRTMIARLNRAADQLLAGRKSLITIPVYLDPSPGAVKTMVDSLKEAKKQHLALAVASENLGWTRKLVEQALVNAKAGQYADVTLAIVAPEAGTVNWNEIKRDTGLTIILGGLGD